MIMRTATTPPIGSKILLRIVFIKPGIVQVSPEHLNGFFISILMVDGEVFVVVSGVFVVVSCAPTNKGVTKKMVSAVRAKNF